MHSFLDGYQADLCNAENNSGSRRKVVAQEIKSYDGLRKYYREVGHFYRRYTA